MSELVPLTGAERAVWLASLRSANPLSYNAACILAIDGALSTRRLLDALSGALTGAGLHALSVAADKGGCFWRESNDVADAVNIDVLEAARSDPLERLSRIFYATPIRPDSAPLIFVHVLPQHSDQHYVMLRHHHVLLDFEGAAALLNRAAAIYNGDDLPEAQHRRVDIALAEQAYLNSNAYLEDERYWQNRMADLAPGALSNPALCSNTTENVDFAISREAFAAFAGAARAAGGTPFRSLLLIAYAHLQHEQKGDVVFGIPLAGREKGALTSQSRMLPFRIGPSEASALRAALKGDLERARFPVWQNAELIFPAERRGALPKVALNYMRAGSYRFGAASGVIARSLYGERNADTYVRCVEEVDGGFSITLDSARDRSWLDRLGGALIAGLSG